MNANANERYSNALLKSILITIYPPLNALNNMNAARARKTKGFEIIIFLIISFLLSSELNIFIIHPMIFSAS